MPQQGNFKKGTNQFMRMGHTSKDAYGSNFMVERYGKSGDAARDVKPYWLTKAGQFRMRCVISRCPPVRLGPAVRLARSAALSSRLTPGGSCRCCKDVRSARVASAESCSIARHSRVQGSVTRCPPRSRHLRQWYRDSRAFLESLDR